MGDHVGFHRLFAESRGGLPATFPSPHLDGLESPADGENIIRGLIARGHSNATITRVAEQNAIDLLRRTIG